MTEEIIETTARKFALKNAVDFHGKADLKAVIGKTIGVLKKNGFTPREIIPVVKKVVDEVNQLPMEEQLSVLKKLAPETLVVEKKPRELVLPDLPDAETGKVVTRFPPEPNGYLHIGHAKASIIDYEYAKKYDGRFILRFDDTNPENAKLEFYDVQKEDLIWLGIEWDEEYNTSDNIERHYRYAEKLVLQGDAYVCVCASEEIKKQRFLGETCRCRGKTPDENLESWKAMLSSSLDNAVLRLKGDMKSDNTAMRDPTLFRITEKTHPLKGDKYRVWPTYDFAGAIEDSLSGVTHPFRTKEYELRDECYFYILDLLNLRKPNLMEFARLSIKDMPVSKRKIKPLIEKGLVKGYDDIRLPTLRGLKKRGITPEAIKKFVLSQGVSKTESVVDMSLLEAENRKAVDRYAKRFFFVKKPVRIRVVNAPFLQKNIRLHPDNEELGFRTIKTGDTFFVEKNDLKKLKTGDLFRLKDLYNVEIIEKKDDLVTVRYSAGEMRSDTPKIHWTNDEYVKLTVYVPYPIFKNGEYNPDSLKKIEGIAEKDVLNLKTGEIVQFERFGFVRIEKKNEKIVGYFAHK